MAQGPMTAEANLRPVGSRGGCPRCGAPITGDYKFCPACAFRLRGVDVESPPPASGSRWRTGFVVATAAAVLLAAAVVGILLFHPTWLARPRPETPPAPPEWRSYVSPAFDVARLRDDLVEIGPGFAYQVPVDALEDEMREAVRARFPDAVVLDARIPYPLRILRYEVTRGQYDEFLRDVYDHPERLPRRWREEMRASGIASPEEVVLRYHVPLAWQVKAERRGTPSDAEPPVVGWNVLDADRNLPVTHVSYYDAEAFCAWASERLGIPLRLPLTMEWVHAARGGRADALWPWGDKPLVYACNNLGSFGRPQFVHFRYSEPVGSWGTTPDGLFAMAGNVGEWTLDHAYAVQWGAEQAVMSQPPFLLWRAYAPAEMPARVAAACGGSWKVGIGDCQTESRANFEPRDASHEDVGFRVVADPAAEDGR